MKEYLERTALTEKKSAIKLRVKKATEGNAFGDAEIYVRSSDKSGDFYTKYNLCYEKDPATKAIKMGDDIVPLVWENGTNGGYNRSNYRIKAGYVCKWNSDTDTFEEIYPILQQGEISMGVKEIRRSDGAMAGDFVGGYHGDENIKITDGVPQVKMTLDGKEISLDGGDELFVEGNELCFEQTTLINRCNTPKEVIIEHGQIMVFNTSGIHERQSAVFLSDDYEEQGKYMLDNGQSCLQMFTLFRIDMRDKVGRMCDLLNFYDENKKLVASADTSECPLGYHGWTGNDTQKINRYVEYRSKDKGVYALAGFKILNDSVDCHSAKIMIRAHGDNKLYCSFESKNPTRQPIKGERWELDLLYYIDYNSGL